ncbi:MAG TPA: mechanosensitive ion channel protein MscS [Flavobacteriales bacterium]|nr:mechanosensitive ion channel protein MscS [Flavobacteriales bacterium]
MEMVDTYAQKGMDLLWVWGPKVLGALIFLVIGLWVVSRITKMSSKMMKRRNIDENLQPVLKGILNMMLKVLVVVSFIGMLGIEATSFVAILGAAGFAIGMALSGTLGNFAGGIMILLFKPFVKGDVIEASGYVGSVHEVQIFNTILKTPDNKTIIIPNGGLSSSSMINYSTEATRRVDFSFGIGYGDDVQLAKDTLNKIIEADSRILKDPAPFVRLGAMADSSLNITVRTWVKAEDYWAVHFDMNETVYDQFVKAGLSIPFPQMDVHVHQVK